MLTALDQRAGVLAIFEDEDVGEFGIDDIHAALAVGGDAVGTDQRVIAAAADFAVGAGFAVEHMNRGGAAVGDPDAVAKIGGDGHGKAQAIRKSPLPVAATAHLLFDTRGGWMPSFDPNVHSWRNWTESTARSPAKTAPTIINPARFRMASHQYV